VSLWQWHDGEIIPTDVDVIEVQALEQFRVAGLDCVVRAGFHTLNGYVRRPPLLADLALADLDEVGDPHGGFTFEDPDHGWVGFDTGHAFDYWNPDDLAGLVGDEGLMVAAIQWRIYTDHPPILGFPAFRWTRAAVRAETFRVAWALADYTLLVAASRMLPAPGQVRA